MKFGQRGGRLGLQLALAFVGVALAAVVATIMVTALTVTADEKQILSRQETMAVKAAARGAGLAYSKTGWAQALPPVLAVVNGSGAAAQVRDSSGAIVRSTPGFDRLPRATQHTEPVIAGGQRVGSVMLRFGDQGADAIIHRFDRQLWVSRIAGSVIGALLALVVALVLAPRITAPLNRLLAAAREIGGGRSHARVGPVPGFRDVRELAGAFDQMADALGRQEQLRRNLVANIAHELRTPAAVLQASTEAMLDGVSEVTPAQVGSLHEETLRLGRMIDDLQRLASAEAAAVQLTLQPHDLAEPAAAAADSLAEIFENAQVRLVRRLKSVQAECDVRRLHDMITNLLTNAAKFTPPGGEVTLETSQRQGMAMLSVSDTGVGIPAEELPYIFDRFFRGTNSSRAAGSGIGLTIVAELVRAHNGSLQVSSEPGQGTRMTIMLPLAKRQAPTRHDDVRIPARG